MTGRLLELAWLPDPNHSAQTGDCVGIVFHSGDKRPGVAEAALKMDISYHVAWNESLGAFVQLVDLDRRAWHAGAPGNGWIGVAVAGPASKNPRTEAERKSVRGLVELIKEAKSSVRFWCRHSDIEPGKSDPGPGFLDSWMDGLLVHGIPAPSASAKKKGGEVMSFWVILAILGGCTTAGLAYYRKTTAAVITGGASLLVLVLHFAKVLPAAALGAPKPVTENNPSDVTKQVDDPTGDVTIGDIKITQGGKETTWTETDGEWSKDE